MKMMEQQSEKSIVEQMLQLQCEMNGGECKRDASLWNEWAAKTLPPIWKETQPSPIRFCREVHRRFVTRDNSCATGTCTGRLVHFQSWKWDFLSALFESATCNCVCGTLYVLSCAQYVGLFPRYVYGMVSPNHIWVCATTSLGDREDGNEKLGMNHSRKENVYFLETTLRPNKDPHWTLTPEKAREFDIYGRGAWYPYKDAHRIVQEAFINQLIVLSDKEKQSEKARRVWALVHGWDIADCVLDVQLIKLKHMAHNARKANDEQLRAAETLVRSISEIIEKEANVQCEAFMRALHILANWTAWAWNQNAFVVNGAKRFERVFRFVWQCSLRIAYGLKHERWSKECRALREGWDDIRMTLSIVHLDL